MEFKSFHKLFFNAKFGAFSKVTEREYFDSQITLTGFEAEIVINHFGEGNIHVGKVKDKPSKASKKILNYKTGKYINLNLVYPKPSKPELRLYLAKRENFKPEAGMIWFLFITERTAELVIGALNELEWNNLGQIDEEDDTYIQEIHNYLEPDFSMPKIIEPKIAKVKVGEKIIYKRNPQLALIRFHKSNFKCEIDSSHVTFTSQRTNRPFLEAHHFIPMKFQEDFTYPLDNIDNIISLCPTCHRAFHHAIPKEKINFISNIYRKRSNLHQHSLEDIAGYYNCFSF